MEILKRVIKKSLVIILPIAVVSSFFEWYRLPLGIIIGGVFGVLNLAGLVRSVEGAVGTEKAKVRIIIFSIIRLFILFAVIFILIWLKIVNIPGMILGFTVVFVLILYEGTKVGKST